MVLGINIGLLLGLIVSPILYALIIYLTSPFGTIKLRRGFHHIMAGVSSVLLLSFIWLLFPNWGENPVDFFNTFFYIAPKEELVKLLAFISLGTVANRSKRTPCCYYVLYGYGWFRFCLD